MSRVHEALKKAEKENQQHPPIQEIESTSGKKRNFNIPDRPSGEEKVFPPAEKLPDVIQEEPLASTSVQIKEVAHSKLVALSSPQSVPAERYRALKTKLYQMQSDSGLKTLLITSAAPSEGKTLTAINLALTLAQEIDDTVLLIDGDLRKPSIHTVLGMNHGSGLADYLAGQDGFDKYIVSTSVKNLSVMPAGQIPGKPAELLNTQRMRDLMAGVKNDYSWVILDSPPVGPLADAELLSALVDGVLFVVRALQSPAALVQKNLQALKGKNIVGLVFNAIKNSTGSEYYYYYTYGQKEHEKHQLRK